VPLLLAFNGEMTPETRLAAYRIEANQIPFMEKTTTQQPGSEASTFTREIKRSIVSPPLTPAYPFGLVHEFRADYFASIRTWDKTDAENGYNNQNVVSVFTLGPFTSEFPPRDDLGGR
jgi:hypothetical protein